MSPAQFIALLTQAEQAAISAASLQAPQILAFLKMLGSGPNVSINDTRTVQAFSVMVSLKIMAQVRADALMAAIKAATPAAPAIVASAKATASPPQIDGSFWVTETYTVSDGTVWTYQSLYPQGADYQAVVAKRAASMNASLIGATAP
jgi:hypothetical protein